MKIININWILKTLKISKKLKMSNIVIWKNNIVYSKDN